VKRPCRFRAVIKSRDSIRAKARPFGDVVSSYKIYERSEFLSQGSNTVGRGGDKIIRVVRSWWGYKKGRGKPQKPSTGHRPAPRGKRSEQQKRRQSRSAASAAENGPEKPPKERTRGRPVFGRPRETTTPRHEPCESRRLASDRALHGHEAKVKIIRTMKIVRGGVVFERVGGWGFLALRRDVTSSNLAGL